MVNICPYLGCLLVKVLKLCEVYVLTSRVSIILGTQSCVECTCPHLGCLKIYVLIAV